MTRRLATVFAVVLLEATPVPAQEPGRELEFGGGWFQWNPLGIDDISVLPSGPSLNLTWASWHSKRQGVTAVLAKVDPREHNQVLERAFPVYTHATYRWRWRQSDPGDSVHFGLGGGLAAWRQTNRVSRWNPDTPGDYFVDTESAVRFFGLWHAELFLTRRVRDDLDVRAGVTFMPVPWPMTAQPVVMAVWRF